MWRARVVAEASGERRPRRARRLYAFPFAAEQCAAGVHDWCDGTVAFMTGGRALAPFHNVLDFVPGLCYGKVTIGGRLGEPLQFPRHVAPQPRSQQREHNHALFTLRSRSAVTLRTQFERHNGAAIRIIA